MKFDYKEKLEKCYNSIEELYHCQSSHLDCFDIVKTVEKYRRYWKPDKVNVLLLAESHIYTTPEECELTVGHAQYGLNDSPTNNFVRFVYCLGYGENKLLSNRLKNNNGTPQYWKLLFSCTNKITKNEDFPAKLLKKSNWKCRVEYKFDLLKELQEKGIWLVDASIVGLYPKKYFCEDLRNQIILKCLKNYIYSVINYENPDKIIIIGKGLHKFLSTGLPKYKPECIYQPQARLKSNGHIENYQKLRSLIKKSVPSRR